MALQLPTLAEDALATGADPIGVTAAPMTRFQGARNVAITDLSDERLTLVETSGIISIVNTGQEGLEEVYGRFSMKEGFDTGLEISGSDAALRSVANHMIHGGRIASLGTPPQELTVDSSKIIFSILTI